MKWQAITGMGAVLMMLTSSCDVVREILPNDLSDPAHARYVASGDKAKDRQQFEAYIFVCNDLLQPYFEAEYEKCLLRPGYTSASCRSSMMEFGTVIGCAAALVDYHPGARRYEFNDPNSL